MTTFLADLQYAWRAWRASFRRHGSTAIVVLTLALGIAATSVVFGLVDGLLHRLPYPHAERMVTLAEIKQEPNPRQLRVSLPNFEDWRAQAHAFTAMAAYAPGHYNLTGEPAAERVYGAGVSQDFFRVVGVRFAYGRDFLPEESANGDRVVLISHGLWQGRYGGAPGILGQTVSIDGVARRVIGVVPNGLEFPPRAVLWVPLSLDPKHRMRAAHSLLVAARLRPGAGLAAGKTDLDTIARRLAAQYPATNAGFDILQVPVADQLVGDARGTLWILMAAVSALLLMACVSVASVLFARGVHRGPEIAMRKALGASRGRIVVQLLGESCLSALLAGVLGILLTRAAWQLVVRLLPSSLAQLRWLALDVRVEAFALLLALATTLVFGLVPALRFSGGSLIAPLKTGGVTADRRGHQLRSGLIAFELMTAFVLLVSSLLLTTSLMHLEGVAPGFKPDHVLSVTLGLSSGRYEQPPQVLAFYHELIQRVRGLPGVVAAGAADQLPMTGSTEGTPFLPEGTPRPRPGQDLIARDSIVTPGYFKALGVPLLRGRDYTESDGAESRRVIVSETMAREYWGGIDALGKRMRLGQLDHPMYWEIVGVVGDVRDEGPGGPLRPRVYLPHGLDPEREMTLAVRTAGDPLALVGAVRRELAAMDPTVPLYSVATAESLVGDALARPRLVLAVVGAFTVLALLLAALGVYGIMAANLVHRTKEFGIRIALGSRLVGIFWLLLREGLALAAAGIVAGLLVARGSTRLLSSLLFGVTAGEPGSYLAAAAVLLAVALLACLLLLRRLGALQPTTALRYE